MKNMFFFVLLSVFMSITVQGQGGGYAGVSADIQEAKKQMERKRQQDRERREAQRVIRENAALLEENRRLVEAKRRREAAKRQRYYSEYGTRPNTSGRTGSNVNRSPAGSAGSANCIGCNTATYVDESVNSNPVGKRANQAMGNPTGKLKDSFCGKCESGDSSKDSGGGPNREADGRSMGTNSKN